MLDAGPSDAAPSRDRALLGHRSDERFAFASTDKVFIAAAVLSRISDAGLAEVVRYDRTDLLAYAPVTSQHVDSGMTVRALLDAALRYSDNTAANLLMERAGGAAGVQAFLRTLGDSTTSVDRDEPSLNTAVPGDTRDTTTPQAFARDLRAVTTRTVLPDSRRRLLVSLMTANTTGAPYIRSGVPTGWSVADKTGSASYGVRNDIALVTPPAGSPLVIVLFSTRTTQDAASQDALLADATRALVEALPTTR
ncbi:class A beta-lactamase [Frondihabitans peucedani]|uniref:Beta-lactamase n=1 Tax=Frondihabitans peucedani TaxID=598626 RepID=A0ABP8E577_9MICO